MSVDWNDSTTLSNRANEIIQLANEYRKTRKLYADAKFFLDIRLAIKYKNKTLNRKLSYEKALIMLCEDSIGQEDEDVVLTAYKDFIEKEADYKGLERVIEANQNRLSLCQSLIKNQVRNT